MSDLQTETRPFLDLYRSGQVPADAIHDFIDAWHDGDESDPRPLAEYLGMSEDEYTLWLASRRILPLLVAAKSEGWTAGDIAARHLADLQQEANPADAAAIYVLTNWLRRRQAPQEPDD